MPAARPGKIEAMARTAATSGIAMMVMMVMVAMVTLALPLLLLLLLLLLRHRHLLLIQFPLSLISMIPHPGWGYSRSSLTVKIILPGQGLPWRYRAYSRGRGPS